MHKESKKGFIKISTDSIMGSGRKARSTSLIFERVPEMVGRVKSIAAELDELQS